MEKNLPLLCYYVDGNTKALWSKKRVKKNKVTMLGRVMGCLEQVFVHGAQGPVELAVSNLVRNALEASPPETKVFVEVVAESDMALVRVRDAGPGVPDEVADRVFEPFFTTKDKRGGTGLGLSMTRDMIAQLGGEVGLENAPEGGALATIKIQRCRESEAS